MRLELAGGYVLDDDRNRLDVRAVHDYLSNHSYWAAGRSFEMVAGTIAGSARVIGLYLDDLQVGYCRVVTDGFAVAYLADVYVLAEHRGHGLGKELVRWAVGDGPHAGLRWILHTADAHDLYRQFGFAAPGEMLMERPRTAPAG